MNTSASHLPHQPLPTPHIAARHISTEASTLLTSLRGGPPHVARGEVAAGLHALRGLVRSMAMEGFDNGSSLEGQQQQALASPRRVESTPIESSPTDTSLPPPPLTSSEKESETNASTECPATPTQPHDVAQPNNNNNATPTPHAVSPRDPSTLLEDWPIHNPSQHNHSETDVEEEETINDPGPYVAPFLSVIIDPRFSGPHTLTALRSLHRLLSRGSILPQESSFSTYDANHQHNYPFQTHLRPIVTGVLACRFEQTDAGADEAVEMAIADLLGLLVSLDGMINTRHTTSNHPSSSSSRYGCSGGEGTIRVRPRRLPTGVITESFHAVFTTRQTFVKGGVHLGHYSPALSNHFEQVLMKMICCVFGDDPTRRGEWRHVGAAGAILNFLVEQIGNVTARRGASDVWTEGDTMHQDGRALCLRLIQCCIKTGWGMGGSMMISEEDSKLLRVVEDDLCLALLTTGQAIWAEDESRGDAASMEVLSEVCSTLSLLWSLEHLRKRLHSQFVAIFSGFYQRALSLLRKRPFPEDGLAYQSNIAFDLEAEVILESLVDILSLHGESSLSTLEELFGTYDCSMTELDVASGLLVELSLCCGGSVDEEGEAIPYSAPLSKTASSSRQTPSKENHGPSQQMTARYRPVPDHLKELCSQALLGCIKQLCRQPDVIRDAQQKEATNDDNKAASSGSLRRTKEQKRILHHAAKLFNDKPSKGIQYLLDNEILPNPVTPESVSSFLRNGLVVGLDKTAVGQYLGEKGKAPSPDKPPKVWDLEQFHKDVLAAFCSSFAFKNQSLLDGLRMFLATFRLPGEAQMIDRILQGFSESCGCSCEESQNGSLKLFSKDEKRASDAAYLLSFSIIMLNTDLHNDNIRADRKMKVNDFVKNNTNYGKEISDSDLPRDYLEKLYNNIKTNQIRTLGEGADGSMTIERWKDVMRGATSQSTDLRGVKDLKELLLESSWQPIFSAISGLWGMDKSVDREDEGFELIQTGRLQNARLGIELADELLSGANGRPDIFQDLFTHICLMTGLLGEYNAGPDERSFEFMQSIERQSALIVAMKVCLEHGDVVGLDGWKCVWGMIFELRDLRLLSARGSQSVMAETDEDLLSLDARQEFSIRLTRGDDFVDEGPRQGRGLFGALFRAASSTDDIQSQMQDMALSVHCKDIQLLWDDAALSDEDSDNDLYQHESSSFTPRNQSHIGFAFQNRLISENASGEHDMPVTGLERLDDEGADGDSLRARVRGRLWQLIDFHGLVSESRFLDFNLGLSDCINALVEIIHDAPKQRNASANDGSEADEAFISLPLSPASEALAEILLCEITFKNRDRFATIWEAMLSAHYNHRLSKGRDEQLESIKLTPGIEKCVTSVLRICNFAINRNSPIASEVLATLNILHPPLGSLLWSPLELNLDRHLSEGIWRICQNVDGLSQVNARGWEGILGLLEWCASRGGLPSLQPGILADDDPSLQAFRSLHLLLHAKELKESVPPSVVTSIRCLVEAGERANSTRLSIAGLDLLQVLHFRLESSLTSRNQSMSEADSKALARYWLPILEAIAEPAEKSRNASVRQQAISLLTDALLDRHGSSVPKSTVCCIINGLCIPLAEKRITDLLRTRGDESDYESTMVELELCISLLFKPLLHHLKVLLSIETEFIGIWISLLGIMTQLLGDEPCSAYKKTLGAVLSRESLLQRTKELGSEHLRNAIMVMFALGVLTEEGSDNELSSVTWAAIGSIGYCKPLVDEWKQSAMVDTGIAVGTNTEA